MLCDSQDGPTTDQSGPEAAPVSHSATQESVREPQMSDTCGLSLRGSLDTASLSMFLGSKLRQRLEGIGSPLYELTWKEWAMQSGPPICALRASARRTSDKDCGGGGTQDGQPPAHATGRTRRAWSAKRSTLTEQSAVASTSFLDKLHSADGWPTPNAHDPRLGYQRRRGDTNGTQKSLETVAVDALDAQKGNPAMADWKMSGWPTPDAAAFNVSQSYETIVQRRTKMKAKHGNGNGAGLTIGGAAQAQSYQQVSGAARITRSGEMLTGSMAGMEGGGQLDPAHSRWVMGYPPEWCDCAVTATQSFPKSRKRSSKPSVKP